MISILIFINSLDQFENENRPNHHLCKQIKTLFPYLHCIKMTPIRTPNFPDEKNFSIGASSKNFEKIKILHAHTMDFLSCLTLS